MGPQTPGGFTSAAGGARRQENLALAYQELITVGERLRTGRQQVTDSVTFRQQLLGAIDQSGDAGTRPAHQRGAEGVRFQAQGNRRTAQSQRAVVVRA